MGYEPTTYCGECQEPADVYRPGLWLCETCEDMKMERATLSVDGNCGCALLGADIQEGEAEFVEDHDVVKLAQTYLAMNAAESGADVLISGLMEEVERLRAILLQCKHGAEYPDELGDVIDAALTATESPEK